MPRPLGTLARAFAAPALLLLVWQVVDGPAALERLGQARLPWLALALALVQLQVVLSALRWRLSAARLGQPLAPRRAIAEYYLATLLNQTLPGGVAGDAVRVVRSGADAPPARAAQSVLVERLGGQLALVAVAVLGMLLWPFLVGASLPRAALATLCLAAALAVGGGLLVLALARFGPPALARFARELGPALRRAWFDDGVWLPQGVLSVAVVASYLGVFACVAHAIDAPLPLAALLTLVPVTLMSMLVPVSVGGWGVRETVAAALWPLAGLAPEAGVATSVLYGLVSLAGAAPGLAIAFAPRARGARRRVPRRGAAPRRDAVLLVVEDRTPTGARRN